MTRKIQVTEGAGVTRVDASGAQPSAAPVAETPRQISPRLQSARQAKDGRGRIFFLQKLKPSDKFDIAVRLGELADNNSISTLAYLATSAMAIFDPAREDNSEDMMTGQVYWNTPVQLRALLDRIDDDGMSAIQQGWREAGWLGSAKDAETAQRDAVKNG